MRNTPSHVAVPDITKVTPSPWTAEEQKLIDTARDILVRQRNLSTEDALAMLNDMADKRKTGLVDISSQLVTITKKLTV